MLKFFIKKPNKKMDKKIIWKHTNYFRIKSKQGLFKTQTLENLWALY